MPDFTYFCHIKSENKIAFMAQIIINTDNQEQLRNEIIVRMQKGVVTFAYKKKTTGELRIAHGTLDTSLYDYTSKGSHRKMPDDQYCYWDMDKQGWRCFKDYNLIKIIDNE